MFSRLCSSAFHQARRPFRSVSARPLQINGIYAGGLVLFSAWAVDRKKGESRVVSYKYYETTFDANDALGKEEQTCFPDRSTGIYRYDTVQFSSDKPPEDAHAEATLPIPSGHWSFFGVYDGHNGRDTSACLRENLILATSGALADLYSNTATPTGGTPHPPSADVERTIKDAFKRLDDDIVHWAASRALATTSRTAATHLLAPAYAGSCAVLAFYDSHTRLLRTALTGDSRAVLGRRTTDKHGAPVYEVHLLSIEQNGYNPAEEYRLNARHPGEAVVKDGRVLGMGPSRAFGDAMYKWDRELQWTLKRSHLGRTPRPSVKTPPYLTAEPEVTTIEVRPGDFVILGTDGLWECLTSGEAVGLVGLWLEKQRQGTEGAVESQPVARKDLPVKLDDEDDDSVRYRRRGAEKQFVNLDRNAATHLLRNALGGANGDLTSALLSTKTPHPKAYVDDITATVIFFAENE